MIATVLRLWSEDNGQHLRNTPLCLRCFSSLWLVRFVGIAAVLLVLFAGLYFAIVSFE